MPCASDDAASADAALDDAVPADAVLDTAVLDTTRFAPYERNSSDICRGTSRHTTVRQNSVCGTSRPTAW